MDLEHFIWNSVMEYLLESIAINQQANISPIEGTYLGPSPNITSLLDVRGLENDPPSTVKSELVYDLLVA